MSPSCVPSAWKEDDPVLIDYVIKYLRCHRSKVCGAIVAPMSEGDTREREEQFTGLSKINDVCTCGLVVTYHESQVEVRLYPRHYNHEIDNNHKVYLPLPKSVIEEITNKFKNGVSIEVILRQTCIEFSNKTREEDSEVREVRNRNMTLYNLKRRYIHDKFRKHPNDKISVKLWAQKYPSDIIYVKFQDVLDDNYPVSLTVYVG